MQERLRILQQQGQGVPPGQYPMPPSMGGIPAPGYGQMPLSQGLDNSMDIPNKDVGPKSKKKKERKPRENKGKAKKGKGSKAVPIPAEGSDSSLQPPPMPHEVYEFEDVPPEVPEKKQKKPRYL